MTQSIDEPQGPGSGAAKPVTDPPGGALDRLLNDEPAEPDEADESTDDAEDDQIEAPA